MQYIVKNGDTLKKIADYYEIDISRLKDYNNLTSDTLEEGMVLNIPLEQPLEYYTVSSGDDLYSIALKYDVPVEFLAKLNGLKTNEFIYPKQELLVPRKGYKIYLTNKGDSLGIVANNLGITIDNIVNNNKNIYLVEDQLIIYR